MLDETLRAYYLTQHPGEAGRVLERSPELVEQVRDIAPETLVPVIERLDPRAQQALFSTLPPAAREIVLSRAGVRAVIGILQGLTESELDDVLASVAAGTASELRKLLAFPENTAGRYMDRPSIRFHTDQTVGEVVDLLRASSIQRARSLYVSDQQDRLAGRVDVQDLATATTDTRLATLLATVDEAAELSSPREALIRAFELTGVDSVPVVDTERRLLGVVRFESLFHAAEAEATAGLQRMVGASGDERALSSPWFAVKKRLPWLHINLLTAFLAASVVALFESTIAQFTALAILLPVVAGQSGNAGSQSLAVTIRGLALKEISTLQWRTVLRKEVVIGLVNGVALAITCGIGVVVWSQSLGLGIVIAIAMVASMIAAGVAGALVPIILVRVGQDPATASSIILTTVTDVSGFISFLGTATLLSAML